MSDILAANSLDVAALLFRYVSDAENVRWSAVLGSRWATGSPSRSHAVNGTRNSDWTAAVATDSGASPHGRRWAPAELAVLTAGGIAPHVLRLATSTVVSLSSSGTSKTVTTSATTVSHSFC
eukprot:163969-Prymnesium_polylepis.4